MFRESQALSELVGDIYDTMLERGSWPSVLEKSAEFVGGSAAAIFSRNQATADGCVYHQFGVDPQDQERFFSTFAELDPAMAESCLAEIGQFVAISDFMPYREIGQTFMNHEQAWPQGLVYRLTTPRDKRANGSALFGVFRHGESASVDDEMRWRADLIVPHIRRAVLIGNVLESKQAEAASYADLLHGLAGGVFLVDRDCRLAFANTAGQAMLDDGRVLHVKDDTLIATDPQVLLPEAIIAAADGEAPIGPGRIAVPLSLPPLEPWLAHVLPLASGQRRQNGSSFNAVAAVFAHRAALEPHSALESLSKLYRLTPGETRVLAALCDAGAISGVAEQVGVSEATIKTHIQHLFGKTGTNRQTELIKLVAAHTSPLRRP
jgi:DNA-binding CsgD family transcriptional regulator